MMRARCSILVLVIVLNLACSNPVPRTVPAATPPEARGVNDDNPSVAALKAIQSARQIVDVHEHIMSMDEVPLMLKTMDSMGVAKTVLMGSSWFTITLNERVGFTRYEENNQSLLDIVAMHPDRFEAWPTLNPEDPDNLERVQRYVDAGATGIKLYIGHGYVRRDNGQYMFHTRAMDDPAMLPIYDFCQKNFIPMCIHVNPHYTKPGFAQEFVAVLTKFPDLKVVAPHFILSSSWYSRFQEYMDTFPNLYTDCSFGDSFMAERLRWISTHVKIMRGLFEKYPDRIMFACDLVVTDHAAKTEEWARDQMQAYLDMLTRDRYTNRFVPKLDDDERPVPGELEDLKGLQLPPDILRKVLGTNYETMKASRPSGTKITREITWGKMRGSRKIDREPGQTFPPLKPDSSE